MTQPKIEGVGHGKPVTLFANDGSNWYAIQVDSDGHVKVDVVTSALPTGAATAARQDTMITALQLIDDLRNALGSVATDRLRVEAKGGDKLLSFDAIVEASVSNLNLSAGVNNLDAPAVGAGRFNLITQAAIRYVGTVPTYIILQPQGIAEALALLWVDSPASAKWYTWSGQLWLQENDYMRVSVLGATAGDDLYLRFAGFGFDAP